MSMGASLGGDRVGFDVERAEQSLAKVGGLLVLRHVSAFFEPDERLAARHVECVDVASYERRRGRDVVSALEEYDGDLDARDRRAEVEVVLGGEHPLLRALNGAQGLKGLAERVVRRHEEPPHGLEEQSEEPSLPMDAPERRD